MEVDSSLPRQEPPLGTYSTATQALLRVAICVKAQGQSGLECSYLSQAPATRVLNSALSRDLAT